MSRKNSQVTPFFIIGLLIVLLLSYATYSYLNFNRNIYKNEASRTSGMSEMRLDTRSYVSTCIKNAVEDSLSESGIRSDTIGKYKEEVHKGIEACTGSLFSILEKEGYTLTKGDMIIEVEQSAETVIVDITYPIVLERDGQKLTMDNFHHTFDRTAPISIPGGVTEKEIILRAPNKKAELRIPKGVRITGADGSPVTSISTKVEDVHFDGLQNKFILGQVVYDNQPDGARFSEPIELSIEFRDSDIPEGYSEDNLKIAWWDPELGIWRAIETVIEGNRAVAKINHFSVYSVAMGRIHKVLSSSGLTFKQRFPQCGNAYAGGMEIGDIWKIAGKDDSQGTATPYQISNVKDDLRKFIGPPGSTDIKLIGDYVTYPVLRYGFRSDGGPFTDCEPAEETTDEATGLTYGTVSGKFNGFNDAPYIQTVGCFDATCNPFVEDCAQYAPESLDKVECEAANEKHRVCKSPLKFCNKLKEDNTQICAPVDSDGNLVSRLEQSDPSITMCRLMNYEEFKEKQEEENQVFGWFNYKCAGGTARPRVEGAADETGSSDMIIMEPDGNAVLLEVQESFGYRPPGDPYEFSLNIDVKSVTEFMVSVGQDPGYICRIIPYPDTEQAFRRISVSDTASAIIDSRLASYYAENPEYQGISTPLLAFGIYGMDVEKTKKTDMCASCVPVWFFWGNGYITNYRN